MTRLQNQYLSNFIEKYVVRPECKTRTSTLQKTLHLKINFQDDIVSVILMVQTSRFIKSIFIVAKIHVRVQNYKYSMQPKNLITIQRKPTYAHKTDIYNNFVYLAPFQDYFDPTSDHVPSPFTIIRTPSQDIFPNLD